MSEYSNEFKGMYPLSATGGWPFGTFGYYDSTTNSWANYPSWGFGLLYYDFYGVQGTSMVNPRPGILTPNPQGISLMYSTQPGGYSQQTFVPASDYTNGIMTNWSAVYTGYCYWLDRDKNTYSPGEDESAAYLEQVRAPTNAFVSSYVYLPDYYKTPHVPAANPRSNPGDILLTDEVFFNDQTGQVGLMNYPTAGVPSSNHVLTNNDFLPVGAHELYNDGSVVWRSMSQIHPRIIIQGGLIMGW